MFSWYAPQRMTTHKIIALITFVVGKIRGYYLHRGHSQKYRRLYASDQ